MIDLSLKYFCRMVTMEGWTFHSYYLFFPVTGLCKLPILLSVVILGSTVLQTDSRFQLRDKVLYARCGMLSAR